MRITKQKDPTITTTTTKMSARVSKTMFKWVAKMSTTIYPNDFKLKPIYEHTVSMTTISQKHDLNYKIYIFSFTIAAFIVSFLWIFIWLGVCWFMFLFNYLMDKSGRLCDDNLLCICVSSFSVCYRSQWYRSTILWSIINFLSLFVQTFYLITETFSE